MAVHKGLLSQNHVKSRSDLPEIHQTSEHLPQIFDPTSSMPLNLSNCNNRSSRRTSFQQLRYMDTTQSISDNAVFPRISRNIQFKPDGIDKIHTQSKQGNRDPSVNDLPNAVNIVESNEFQHRRDSSIIENKFLPHSQQKIHDKLKNNVDKQTILIHSTQTPDEDASTDQKFEKNKTNQFSSTDSSDSTPTQLLEKEDNFKRKFFRPAPFQRGRCGLNNLGNTCFINSALQCLSNASELTKHILEDGFNTFLKSDSCTNTEGQVAIAYAKLIKEMWSGTKEYANASDLKRHVSRLSSRFAGFSQQDSHEFLNLLLDTLHEGLKNKSPDSENVDETSIISDIFYGTLRSTVVCVECLDPFHTDDSFSFLGLPITSVQCSSNKAGHSYEPIKLKDSLDRIFEREMLSENGQWYCNICGHLTDAEKKLDLWTLPKILILQLKRFTYDLSNNNKINTFVNYPLRNLDLSDYVINPDYDRTTRYDLVAVSTHNGSLAGGHYTAFAKNFDTQKWYYFNDDAVCDADEGKIITENAYILVYQQQENNVNNITRTTLITR